MGAIQLPKFELLMPTVQTPAYGQGRHVFCSFDTGQGLTIVVRIELAEAYWQCARVSGRVYKIMMLKFIDDSPIISSLVNNDPGRANLNSIIRALVTPFAATAG